jgi:hypothetical protein
MSIRAVVWQSRDANAPGYCENLGPVAGHCHNLTPDIYGGYAVGIANTWRATKGQSVYLLSTPSGFWKVGVARDPEARRRELQCGCPEPIALVGSTGQHEDGADARSFERLVHEALAPWRSRGEWFRAPEAVVYRAWKEMWCQLRYPPLYQRWQRFSLYIRAVDAERRRLRLVEAT